LEHFWKAVGHKGHEPDPRHFKGKEVVFESPVGYRRQFPSYYHKFSDANILKDYETGVTRKMARDQGPRGSNTRAEDSDEEVQQALSEDFDTGELLSNLLNLIHSISWRGVLQCLREANDQQHRRIKARTRQNILIAPSTSPS
jgi:cysteinyl-tRNA synthetase